MLETELDLDPHSNPDPKLITDPDPQHCVWKYHIGASQEGKIKFKVWFLEPINCLVHDEIMLAYSGWGKISLGGGGGGKVLEPIKDSIGVIFGV